MWGGGRWGEYICLIFLVRFNMLMVSRGRSSGGAEPVLMCVVL